MSTVPAVPLVPQQRLFSSVMLPLPQHSQQPQALPQVVPTAVTVAVTNMPPQNNSTSSESVLQTATVPAGAVVPVNGVPPVDYGYVEPWGFTNAASVAQRLNCDKLHEDLGESSLYISSLKAVVYYSNNDFLTSAKANLKSMSIQDFTQLRKHFIYFGMLSDVKNNDVVALEKTIRYLNTKVKRSKRAGQYAAIRTDEMKNLDAAWRHKWNVLGKEIFVDVWRPQAPRAAAANEGESAANEGEPAANEGEPAVNEEEAEESVTDKKVLNTINEAIESLRMADEEGDDDDFVITKELLRQLLGTQSARKSRRQTVMPSRHLE